MFHLDHRISWYFIFSMHWHFRSKPKDCGLEHSIILFEFFSWWPRSKDISGAHKISRHFCPISQAALIFAELAIRQKISIMLASCRLQRSCIVEEALKILTLSKGEGQTRVEICRDRPDRRSCKICAICVYFPRKQHNFSHNLRRTTRFTHTKYDFALKQFKFYTLS